MDRHRISLYQLSVVTQLARAVFIISIIEFSVFSIGAFAVIEDIVVSLVFGLAGAAAVPLLELRFRDDYEPH